jgi:hypothetical protein
LFNVPADQVTGKKEEKKGRNKRQGGKEQDQSCFKVSADDLPFFFQIEFYQIPD